MANQLRNKLAHAHLSRKLRRSLIAAKRAGHRVMSPNPLNRLIADHFTKGAPKEEQR